MYTQKLTSNFRYTKIVEWGKLISITGTTQVVIQIINFGCGILIIHLLSTKEYALYTLANTVMGTMILLSDGGISTGVMAEAGKVWQDKEKLGTVINTGVSLRNKFSIITLLIAIPVLFITLKQHGATWLASILLLAAIIPTFLISLSSNLLEIPSKLKQDVTNLQKNQVLVSIGRMVLSIPLLFIFPSSFVAIFSASIPQISGNRRLRRISSEYADFTQKPSNEVQNSILSVVKRILPGAIYYCISGQLIIWLASIFGSTNSIAQVGAIGRFSMVLNIFSTVLSILIIPRFSRQNSDKRKLLKQYFLIISFSIIISLLFISTTLLFPNQFLWILGKNYSNLGNILTLSITGSCIGLITGVAFSLVSSRGWATNPIITIPIEIATMIAGIFLIGTSSLTKIYLLNIFILSIQAITYIVYGIFKILKN